MLNSRLKQSFKKQKCHSNTKYLSILKTKTDGYHQIKAATACPI